MRSPVTSSSGHNAFGVGGGYQNSALRVGVLVVVRVGSKTFFTLQTGLETKGAGG